MIKKLLCHFTSFNKGYLRFPYEPYASLFISSLFFSLLTFLLFFLLERTLELLLAFLYAFPFQNRMDGLQRSLLLLKLEGKVYCEPSSCDGVYLLSGLVFPIYLNLLFLLLLLCSLD